MDLISLKKKLDAADGFAQFNGIEVDMIADGGAVVLANINPMSYSGEYISSILISGIGEKAAVCAALSKCESCYCASYVFNLLERCADAKLLKAEAKKVHHGKRTAVYETVISDEKGNLIAKGTYTIIITE